MTTTPNTNEINKYREYMGNKLSVFVLNRSPLLNSRVKVAIEKNPKSCAVFLMSQGGGADNFKTDPS